MLAPLEIRASRLTGRAAVVDTAALVVATMKLTPTGTVAGALKAMAGPMAEGTSGRTGLDSSLGYRSLMTMVELVKMLFPRSWVL